MTYLKPRCSQLAVLLSKAKKGHILLARNFEFNNKMEDFALCSTKIYGKYLYISTSVMQFGRNEITKYDLKQLLSDKYPIGLCCYHYNDFFGTLRGIIFDPNNGTIDVCFGSIALNDWHAFKINNSEKYQEFDVSIEYEETPK